LNSQKYIVMRPDNKSCLVGSTYEHQFTTPKAERESALQEIMPNVLEFFPALKDAQVLNVRAAFRASTPNHLPLVGKVSDKFYFFTGLGSKGLLYHAWVGKLVARALLSTHASHFPEKIHCVLPNVGS
jgi:glycine/D-amino acid oxidase-like deaminating enzyme